MASKAATTVSISHRCEPYELSTLQMKEIYGTATSPVRLQCTLEIENKSDLRPKQPEQASLLCPLA